MIQAQAVVHITTTTDSELLTIGQAASLLGVTLNTLRNWEKRGVLKPFRVGPRQDRRYEKQDVLAFRGSK